MPLAMKTISTAHAAAAGLKRLAAAFASVILFAVLARPSAGHFLVVIPATDAVESDEPTEISCRILFGHPMEQTPPISIGTPVSVLLKVGEATINLRDKLINLGDRDGPWWSVAIPLRRPGDHILLVEAPPHWEETERAWIQHSAKVIVHFAGAQVGWNREIGLPVEIVPLTRPYGLWVGNCFRGQVLYRGKPAESIDVEVEFLNQGNRVQVAQEVRLTQVIKTDAQGIFCYGIPWAGWWGFAALVDGGSRPGPDGQPARLELGGTLWIYAAPAPAQALLVNP